MPPIHAIEPAAVLALKKLLAMSMAQFRASRVDLIHGLDPVALARDGTLVVVELEEVALLGVVEGVAAEEVAELPVALLLDALGEIVEDEVGAVVVVLLLPCEALVVVVGVVGGVLGEADGCRGVAGDLEGSVETGQDDCVLVVYDG